MPTLFKILIDFFGRSLPVETKGLGECVSGRVCKVCLHRGIIGHYAQTLYLSIPHETGIYGLNRWNLSIKPDRFLRQWEVGSCSEA